LMFAGRTAVTHVGSLSGATVAALPRFFAAAHFALLAFA
jgi:hypothetical protein